MYPTDFQFFNFPFEIVLFPDSHIAGIDWNDLGTIPEDYTMAGLSTPRAQTPPPPSVTKPPSTANTSES